MITEEMINAAANNEPHNESDMLEPNVIMNIKRDVETEPKNERSFVCSVCKAKFVCTNFSVFFDTPSTFLVHKCQVNAITSRPIINKIESVYALTNEFVNITEYEYIYSDVNDCEYEIITSIRKIEVDHGFKCAHENCKQEFYTSNNLVLHSFKHKTKEQKTTGISKARTTKKRRGRRRSRPNTLLKNRKLDSEKIIAHIEAIADEEFDTDMLIETLDDDGDFEKNNIILNNETNKKIDKLLQITTEEVQTFGSSSGSNKPSDDNHAKLNNVLVCEICDHTFKRPSSLALHLKCHGVKYESKTKNSFSCKFCCLNFKWASALSRHVTVKHKRQQNLKCPVAECYKLFSKKTEVSEHLQLHDENEMCICEKCNQQCFSLSEFSKHSLIHSKSVVSLDDVEDVQKPIKCSQCSKTFIRKTSYKNHLITHDIPKLSYPCTECGKVFGRISLLNIHLRSHNGVKPYLCTECGKKFSSLRYLTVHRRIHTKERPYLCKICNKGFIQQSNLVEHIRTHTGEKPIACPVENCNKSFAHYSGLKQHTIVMHSNIKKYKCEFCSKEFAMGGHFREHMRTHTGERPCLCKFCGRGFASNSSLIIHERTHTGERPYACMICFKTFIKSYGLTQHLKKNKLCKKAEEILTNNDYNDKNLEATPILVYQDEEGNNIEINNDVPIYQDRNGQILELAYTG